jgi:hypothetical protein
MPITVVAKPTTLTWAHFKRAKKVIDESDGTEQDAYTTFNYALQVAAIAKVDGKFAFPAKATITITPKATVRIGYPEQQALLDHEQFHYDVGVLAARLAAKELAALRSANGPALQNEANAVIDTHLVTRASAIQKEYDKDTEHGKNKVRQEVWLKAMREALAKPAGDCTTLKGLDL